MHVLNLLVYQKSKERFNCLNQHSFVTIQWWHVAWTAKYTYMNPSYNYNEICSSISSGSLEQGFEELCLPGAIKGMLLYILL